MNKVTKVKLEKRIRILKHCWIEADEILKVFIKRQLTESEIDYAKGMMHGLERAVHIMNGAYDNNPRYSEDKLKTELRGFFDE